jgi:hypothetical protein
MNVLNSRIVPAVNHRRLGSKTMNDRIIVFVLCVILAGCGGGPQSASTTTGSTGTPSSPGTPTTPPTSTTPPNIEGAWTFTAKSSTTGNYFVVQTNLTQQSATEYFANNGNTNFYTGTPDASGDGSIDAVAFAAPCDLAQMLGGQNKFLTSLNVTVTDQGAATLEISGINFDPGSDYTGTLQFSSDGNSFTGTYTTPPAPNACLVTPDTGTITGSRAAPLAGTYSGALLAYCGVQETNDFGTHVCEGNNTPETVVLAISETNGAVTLTGSANNQPISMTGTAIGASFLVAGAGPFAGSGVGPDAGSQPVTGQLVGTYDPVANSFRVYGLVRLQNETIQNGLPVDQEFIGVLNAGSDPSAGVKKRSK